MTRDELRQMALDFCSQYTIGEIVTEVTALLVLAAKSGLDEPTKLDFRAEAKGPRCGMAKPGDSRTWCGDDVTDHRYRTTIIPVSVQCSRCLEAMEAAGVKRDAENMAPPKTLCAVRRTLKVGSIADVGNPAESWCNRMVAIDSPKRDDATRTRVDVTCSMCLVVLAAFTGELRDGMTIERIA